MSREISIAVRKKQCYDRKKCENTEYRVRKEGTEEKFERAVIQLARPRWKVREKASTIHPESGCTKMLKFISTPSAGCSFPSSPAPQLPLLPTKSTRGVVVLPPDLQHPGTQNSRTGCPFWVGRMASSSFQKDRSIILFAALSAHQRPAWSRLARAARLIRRCR